MNRVVSKIPIRDSFVLSGVEELRIGIYFQHLLESGAPAITTIAAEIYATRQERGG